MNIIMENLLINCKVASLFFMLLLIIRPITKKYFSQTWHYILLRINLLLFFLPISLFSNGVARLIKQTIPINTIEYIPQINSQINIFVSDTNLILEQTTHNINTVTNLDIFNYLWLLGGGLALSWQVHCRFKLHKELNKSNYIINNFEEFDKCKQSLKINKNIPLIQNNKIYSPVLVGLLKPKILLPTDKLKPQHLEYIFTHELTHYKRKDLWWKSLLTPLYIVFWWNPLVYAFANIFDMVLEYSCDEVVIKNKTRIERKNYGFAILESIDEKQKFTPMLSVSLRTPKQKLENRLKSMMKFNQMKLSTKIISGSLTLTLLFGIATPSIVSALNEPSLPSLPIEETPIVQLDIVEPDTETSIFEPPVTLVEPSLPIEETPIVQLDTEEPDTETSTFEPPVTLVEPKYDFFTLISVPQETEAKFTQNEWEEIISKTLTGELLLVAPTSESEILVDYIEVNDELNILNLETYSLVDTVLIEDEVALKVDSTTLFEFSYGIVSALSPIE